ncbi:MAG: polysaccharide deacetylase family protein [Chitinophagaceae bacterium]|nr:polysaccharide deacetylase family protein [Chitinophagaceae bacterium]
MIIYSHTITSRLQYVIDFLSRYFSHPFKLTANEKLYTSSVDGKINYSHQQISSDEIYILPHALLFETEKRKVTIHTSEFNGYKYFFQTTGDVKFDLFAAIFYLLSRYEEYLPHKKDEYGRYAHENSLAHHEGFLNLPLINIWLEDFRKLLAQQNSKFPIHSSRFTFIPTYDIDIAWSYKNKGFKRNTAGFLQSVVKGDFSKVSERIKVIKERVADPFDSYEWLHEIHQEHDLDPIYFFLVADKKSKYDKNIDITNPEFQQLIKSIASKNKIGLHPSWASGDDNSLLVKEKSFLEQLTERQVTSSRQHFVRFDLPKTFQRLITVGITNDYSMGYGSINGFRASIATPFFWYDLQNEQATKLTIHPFCYMDANSYYEQNLSPEEAMQELQYYYQVIKSVKGTMTTIWHNNFLGVDKEFEGWREVYEQLIQTVSTASK